MERQGGAGRQGRVGSAVLPFSRWIMQGRGAPKLWPCNELRALVSWRVWTTHPLPRFPDGVCSVQPRGQSFFFSLVRPDQLGNWGIQWPFRRLRTPQRAAVHLFRRSLPRSKLPRKRLGPPTRGAKGSWILCLGRDVHTSHPQVIYSPACSLHSQHADWTLGFYPLPGTYPHRR